MHPCGAAALRRALARLEAEQVADVYLRWPVRDDVCGDRWTPVECGEEWTIFALRA